MKECSACRTGKPLSEFYRNKAYRGGYNARCKVCVVAGTAAWAKRNRGHVNDLARKRRAEATPEWKAHRSAIERRSNVKRKYGVSAIEYNRLLKLQAGRCAICGTVPSGRRKNLDVDHCHESGAVRGLLCGSCNAGLGSLGDTPERLERALRYLTTY